VELSLPTALRRLGLAQDSCTKMIQMQIDNSKLQSTVEALVMSMAGTMQQMADMNKKLEKKKDDSPKLPKDLMARIEKLEGGLAEQQTGLGALEEVVTAQDGVVKGMGEGLKDATNRLGDLESRIPKELEGVRQELKGLAADVAKDRQEFRHELQQLDESSAARMSALDERIKGCEQSDTALHARIKHLEDRLAAMRQEKADWEAQMQAALQENRNEVTDMRAIINRLVEEMDDKVDYRSLEPIRDNHKELRSHHDDLRGMLTIRVEGMERTLPHKADKTELESCALQFDLEQLAEELRRSSLKFEASTIARLKDLARMFEKWKEQGGAPSAGGASDVGIIEAPGAGVKLQMRCISCDQRLSPGRGRGDTKSVEGSDGFLYWGEAKSPRRLAEEHEAERCQLNAKRKGGGRTRPASARGRSGPTMTGANSSLGVARTSLGACNGSASRARPRSAVAREKHDFGPKVLLAAHEEGWSDTQLLEQYGIAPEPGRILRSAFLDAQRPVLGEEEEHPAGEDTTQQAEGLYHDAVQEGNHATAEPEPPAEGAAEDKTRAGRDDWAMPPSYGTPSPIQVALATANKTQVARHFTRTGIQ